MGAYVIRRALQMIPTALGVILFVFVLFHTVGGDPSYILAGKSLSPTQIAQIRSELGLDEPFYMQLLIFVKQVLTFDFGASWVTGEPVSKIFLTRLGPSLVILVPLLLLETLVSIALALAIVKLKGDMTEKTVMGVCTAAMAVSVIVYIIVFQVVLAHGLGWFPVQGFKTDSVLSVVRHAALPVIILLCVSLAPNVRLYRTFLVEQIRQDYVRTAKAKGLSDSRILWVHVLRNAAIPVVTHVMGSVPALLAGAFLVERFFSIPGIGREIILAVERSDFPVIKAVTVYVAFATMVVNLLTDVIYRRIDPRVRPPS